MNDLKEMDYIKLSRDYIEALEKYIKVTPCDPDITNKQIEAHQRMQSARDAFYEHFELDTIPVPQAIIHGGEYDDMIIDLSTLPPVGWINIPVMKKGIAIIRYKYTGEKDEHGRYIYK